MLTHERGATMPRCGRDWNRFWIARSSLASFQRFAAYAASEGRLEDAARLLGEARREGDEIGAPEGDFAHDMVAWAKGRARGALGDDAFEAAYAAGRENAA